ncbi:ATP-binding protein [Kitasatospora phosalacinea]|uniref:ATP-binding protein n=1 Tax=Kitasatospora phosalacinea TaxID=2065 RepID=UPI0035DDF71B
MRNDPDPEPPRRRLSFPARTEAPVGPALDFTRRALAAWHLWEPPPGRPHLADDTLLVVGELLSNACDHGGGPRYLELERRPGAVRVTVGDRNRVLPRRRPTGPGAPHGFGTVVLDRLTTRWGAVAGQGGKSVWAELATG